METFTASGQELPGKMRACLTREGRAIDLCAEEKAPGAGLELLDSSSQSAREERSLDSRVDGFSSTSYTNQEVPQSSRLAEHDANTHCDDSAHPSASMPEYISKRLQDTVEEPGRLVLHPTVTGDCAGRKISAENVGTADRDIGPRFEHTVPEAASAYGRSLMRNTADRISDTSPKVTIPIVLNNTVSSTLDGLGSQGVSNSTTLSTLDLQKLPLQVPLAEYESHHNKASISPDQPQAALRIISERTASEPEETPHISPIPNYCQPESERPSTPLSLRETPALASPVHLKPEPSIHSTPPSSPVKLSSPPRVKPPKKVARARTGLNAPFKSPFRRPIPCALPNSSPLPPSSPPPLPDSSPPSSVIRKRRAETPPEDRQVPTKVRRTGRSPFSLVPFVSPVRGLTPHNRPPAGGFSTPLRPSRVERHTLSSPALPTEPDVFTTSATATAYKLSSQGSDPISSDADLPPSSSTRKLRLPFKTPGKSTGPTSATVQALKQRVQSLRTALRIRGVPDPTRPGAVAAVVDDDALEALGIKWRNAAREAAQDLWALVKDTTGGDSWGGDDKHKNDSWGWDTQSTNGHSSRYQMEQTTQAEEEDDPNFTPPDGNKVYKALVKNLGRPFIPRKTMLPPYDDPLECARTVEDEEMRPAAEEEASAHTLGTMLTSLGIPHEVLGWKEEEGEFMD